MDRIGNLSSLLSAAQVTQKNPVYNTLHLTQNNSCCEYIESKLYNGSHIQSQHSSLNGNKKRPQLYTCVKKGFPSLLLLYGLTPMDLRFTHPQEMFESTLKPTLALRQPLLLFYRHYTPNSSFSVAKMKKVYLTALNYVCQKEGDSQTYKLTYYQH